ncbi:penicillin-binding protein 1A [Pyruvatibacter sp.]|uniref:penicillin-binding protein 1A n=1 Tax=Pyruvatibacter sp. TaxID=1981328 RepID=UPI0032EE313C
MMRILAYLGVAGVVLASGAALGVAFLLWSFSRDLPPHDQLAVYEPPVMTRVHADDGSLIAEFARERRLYVPITAIPKDLINAFLSAEDKNFYDHEGVDMFGVLRATVSNVSNYFNDRRLEGASTITQQVAKNFLLTNEVSFERKIKEALLARRIESAYSKDRILELYLNEIFLGLGSYGVAAAALNYFGKSLDELTLGEMAYLAALPKAPNNYHPFRARERAIARRNWVLARMTENGLVTPFEASVARAEPFNITPRAGGTQIVATQYFVEEVRRRTIEQYGDEKIYDGGLSVRTTVDTNLQALIRGALRESLVAYDRRHGWRGPFARMEDRTDWPTLLVGVNTAGDLAPWRLAVVLDVTPEGAEIGLRPDLDEGGNMIDPGETGYVPLSQVKWARKSENNRITGPEVTDTTQVLAAGDVIWVSPAQSTETARAQKQYMLRQIPEVNGAVVAMDPHTGRVRALVGGFSYQLSEFNRATQAIRQPGSAFKPFVYAAALDNGYTPSSLVLDAPFVIEQGPGLALWKPENYSRTFYGPSTLRLGLEKSRNVMTVRLAQAIGMDKVSEYARRFGIMDDMMPVLAMSLGAGETTLLKMTNAYSMLVNGGKRIEPVLIDRIQDRFGRTIYRNDVRECPGCAAEEWTGQAAPTISDTRERVIDPRTAYQVVSMLRGVVERGTGRSIAAVGKPLAGKTGTTNREQDAWFVGFSPDLALGVFIGFDEPKPMGRGETGGGLAAPVFRDIMAVELADKPAIPFRIPPGVTLVRVDAKSGLIASPGAPDAMLEAFKAGTEPRAPTGVLRGTTSDDFASDTAGPVRPVPTLGTGTGGLY